MPRITRLVPFALVAVFCVFIFLVGRRSTTYTRHDIIDPASLAGTKLRYLFAFGDSFTETDFDVLTDKPNVTYPFGRTTLGHTSTGSPNYLQYLIHNLSAPSTIVYNFAVGGAVVDNKVLEILPELALPDFQRQRTDFDLHLVKHRDFAEWNGNNSVFLVWFGANDVHFLWRKYETNSAEKTREDITAFFEQLDELYRAGVRKFVVFNSAPLWRNSYFSSRFTDLDSNLPIARITTEFNKQLEARAAEWSSKVHDTAGQFELHIIDSAPIWNEVLDNPVKYGAPNATCEAYNYQTNQDSGNGCLWWDTYHPGLAINIATAEALHGMLTNMGFWEV